MPQVGERDGHFGAALANAHRADELDALAGHYRGGHRRHTKRLANWL